MEDFEMYIDLDYNIVSYVDTYNDLVRYHKIKDDVSTDCGKFYRNDKTNGYWEITDNVNVNWLKCKKCFK